MPFRKAALAAILGLIAAGCGTSDGVGAPSGGTASSGADATGGGAGGSGAGAASGTGANGGGGSSAGGAGATGGAGADGGGPSTGGGNGTAPVSLGTAASYVVLTKTGISSGEPSAVTGDLAVSPGPATYITGFSLVLDATGVFSKSKQVTGKLYAADHAAPTPSELTVAVGDMEAAFTDAAARAADVTALGAGSIGGMTIGPGVYRWVTPLLIPATVTLSGGASDVWIFQIAGDLELGTGVKVSLTGGAVPANVFWQVAGKVVVGTTGHLEGIVLGKTAAMLHSGASINGRLLMQTAVTLDGSTVVQPVP
jgi:hypothetical protein